MTRVLVCGPRNYGELIEGKSLSQALDERRRVWSTLDAEHAKTPITVIIHGACTIGGRMSGADRWANEWASSNVIHCERYPVDHTIDGPWHRGAGPRRNRRMRDESNPERGIAFMPSPGTKKSGTLGMVKLMEDAGLNVLKVPQ